MYEKKVSRAEPGLIAFVLDDSASMDDALMGTSDSMYEWVERYGGIILQELLARSTEVRADSVVIKSRYHTHVIAYGSRLQLWGDTAMDIEATVERYTAAGNSLGLGGNLGGTDAEAALVMARDFLREAVTDDRFRRSFPPMVFHLTDGMSATDATSVVEEIQQLATADGNVLVVNAFIGTDTSLNYQGPADFPGYLTADEAGPSDDNIRLFTMSSEAPPCIHQNLVDDGVFPSLRPGARLFFDVRTKEMLKHVIQVVGSIGSHADRQARLSRPATER